MSSVFVSEDGHWKLGGMETVCKFSEATPEVRDWTKSSFNLWKVKMSRLMTNSLAFCFPNPKFLRGIQNLREASSIPPEEQVGG